MTETERKYREFRASLNIQVPEIEISHTGRSKLEKPLSRTFGKKREGYRRKTG